MQQGGNGEQNARGKRNWSDANSANVQGYHQQNGYYNSRPRFNPGYRPRQPYAPRHQYRPRYYSPYHQAYAPQHQPTTPPPKNQPQQQSNPSGKGSEKSKQEKKKEKKEQPKDRSALPTGKLMFIGSITAWKLDTADALAFWKAELMKNNLWNLGNKPLLMLVEDKSHDLESFKNVLEKIKKQNPVTCVILTDHNTTDAKFSSFRK